jgi:O-succinylbenzoate synthase
VSDVLAIWEVELWWCDRQLLSAHRTSYGQEGPRPSLLVKVGTSEGSGWGECAALATPSYRPEHAQAAWWSLQRWLAPALLGARLPLVSTRRELERCSAELHGQLATVQGAELAKAALEAAVLDAALKATGSSLPGALGVPATPGGAVRVRGGAVVGLPTDLAATSRALEQALAEGAGRVKVKIAPGCDLEPLGELRRRFPEAPLAVDANGAYRREDLGVLRRLDDLGLSFLEQPLPPDDLVGHQMLAADLATPICLDESLRSPGDVATVAALRAGDLVCLKPPCLGGVGPTLAAVELAAAAGLAWWIGGMLQGSAGRLVDGALGALPGSWGPAELGPPSGTLRGPDPFGPLDFEGWELRLHPGPGTVPEPDRELLGRLARRRWRLAI